MFMLISIQIWEVSSHFFKCPLLTFLSPPPGNPTMSISVPLMVYHRAVRLWSLLFLFLRHDNFHSPIFKFADSSSNLCVSLVNFLFHLLHSSVSEIFFFFLGFLVLY